jgi:hypothetical protein
VDRSNAERQRRHIGKLKAAAEDCIRLRQENAALQQKVTVLEQKLGQQRAITKAPRPEGLAMKALKAPMTKPNGRVVGFDDANLEFHETDCPPSPDATNGATVSLQGRPGGRLTSAGQTPHPGDPAVLPRSVGLLAPFQSRRSFPAP